MNQRWRQRFLETQITIAFGDDKIQKNTKNKNSIDKTASFETRTGTSDELETSSIFRNETDYLDDVSQKALLGRWISSTTSTSFDKAEWRWKTHEEKLEHAKKKRKRKLSMKREKDRKMVEKRVVKAQRVLDLRQEEEKHRRNFLLSMILKVKKKAKETLEKKKKKRLWWGKARCKNRSDIDKVS